MGILHYLDFFLPDSKFHFIDSYPLFSSASRKRIYVSNISGYRKCLKELAPSHVPSLKECLKWDDDVDMWPDWFDEFYDEMFVVVFLVFR